LSTRAELADEVFAAMRRLSTEIDALDQRAADSFGINRTDLHLIDVLRSSGPLTATQLARAVGLTSGGLSIALERLERLGYIRRSQHPDDRRSVLVEATEALAPLEAETFGPLAEQTQKLLHTYTREQLLTIKHYLENATAITSAAARPPTR
jgi:DNA-binding MarR family transcriptional regulator